LSPIIKKQARKVLVAIVAGTKTEQVIEHVSKIDSKKRQAVIEITLDMANSMKLIAKNVSKSHTSNRSFPCTKLALEALQEIRIKHRWEDGYRESIHTTS
jgi:hypothetical protein